MQGVTGPRRLGGVSFYFRMEEGELVRIGQPGADLDFSAFRPGSGELVAALKGVPMAHVRVDATVFLTDDEQLVVGSIAVQTVPTTNAVEFEDGDPVAISAAVWRQIRVGEIADAALESVQNVPANYGARMPAETRLLWEHVSKIERTDAKRGRKTMLTVEILRDVVAPAYRAGGSKPLQRVQDALHKSGYPGSGPTGDVTVDQARRAVSKARQLGLILPFKRHGKQQSLAEGEL